MSFHLNKGSKVFAASAASFVALNLVSSFSLSCKGIDYVVCQIDSINSIDGKNNPDFPKVFKYDHFYSLRVVNPELTLYFYITNKGGLINYPDYVKFYERFDKNTDRNTVPAGFYDMENCNVSDFNIEEEFKKSEEDRNIKKPHYLDSKLSNKDFYNICKMISYSCV